MKKKEKIVLVLFTIFMILLNGLLLNKTYSLNCEFIVKFLIFSFLTILGSLAIYLNKKIEFQKMFIILYIVIGLGYLFFFPINSLPDESHHFYRAYEISNGHLMSEKQKKEKGYIGVAKVSENIFKVSNVKGTYEDNKKILKLKDNKKNFEYVDLTNISLYSFVCYIPQTLGVIVGRVFNLPIMFWEYLARIFNFVLFVFLLNFSLKKIPFKKTTLMCITMLPMTFQIAVSMSADCMTMGVSLALISYVLSLIHDKDKKIDKKDLTIIAILSIVLALCKIIYLPICLIVFFIPKNKFESLKDKYLKLSLIFIITVLFNFIWLTLASQYLAALNNSGKQLEYIFSNIFNYAYIIINTLIQNSGGYINTMVGKSLGMFCVEISSIYIYLILLIFVFLILFDNKNVINNKYLKIGCLIIFILVFGLMATSLYLDWTSYKANIIDGIQGRYFLPILILVFIMMSNKSFEIKNNKIFNKNLLLLIMLIINFYVINTISLYY